MANKGTWIDSVGIKNGKLGDVVDGVNITEENRATIYEERKAGIQELLGYQQSNYTKKGVKSVIYGVRLPIGTRGEHRTILSKHIYYAIFCEDGFITNAL